MTFSHRKPNIRAVLAVSAVLAAGCAQTEEADSVSPLEEFGIIANNAFFYYDDLEAATTFYTRTLGLRIAADYGFAKILQVAATSYLTLVDADEGMHSTEEPKTVTIALITDQLEEWYAYLVEQGVEMRYEFSPTEGRPHDGFVAYDPEGYYLEFERFNEHPENELFFPLLEQTETLHPDPERETTVPDRLGFKATILWLYHRDTAGALTFLEEKLGLNQVVDQGWAWIYQSSPTGYIGPVDETRGMHSYTDEKAVTVSFFTEDLDGWHSYVSENNAFELREAEVHADSAGRFRAFVGYDPEGYYLEFDEFLEHELNVRLLESLNR